MGRIENAVEVNAPVEKVFAFAADWKCLEVVGPEGSEMKVEKLTEGPLGVGTTWRISGIIGGQRIVNVDEFVEFVENHQVRSRLVSSNIMKRFDVTQVFETTGKGTKYTEIWDYELPYGMLGKVLDKLKVRRDLERYVKAIDEKAKEILEKG